MIATPATLTPPAVDPDLVAAVRRLAAWAGRPCTDAEAAGALCEVLAFNPDQPRVPAGSPEGGEFGGGGGSGGRAGETPAGRKARRREEDRATLRELNRRLAEGGSDAAEKRLREIDRRHAAEDRDVGRSRKAEDRAAARERQREEAALGRRAAAGEERKAGRADEAYEKATGHLDDALNRVEEAEPAGTSSPRYKDLERQLAPEYDRLREEHAGRERAAARAAEQWRQARVAEMRERHAALDRGRAAARAAEDAARVARQRRERRPAEEHAVALRRLARLDWGRTWDAVNERREAEDAARKASAAAGRGHKAARPPGLTAFNPDQPRAPAGSPGGGQFGGGGAAAVKVSGDAGKGHAAIRSLLGPHATPAHVARLAGAPAGSACDIQPHADGSLSVEWMHDGLEGGGARTVGRDGDDVVLTQVHFEIGEAARGRGAGTAIFAEQVRAAAEMGVARIDTIAGKGGAVNGYYTWPRLGYNGPVPASVAAKAPPALRGARDLHDLLSRPGGREFWKGHGEKVKLSFDPRPGSASRKVLDDYVAAKAARVVEGAAAAPPGDSGDVLAPWEDALLDALWDGYARGGGADPHFAGGAAGATGVPGLAAEFNPDQPREPAGSPEGGQFGSGGGGGTGGGGKADPGARPAPPAGGWRDDAHLAGHAAKVVAAHEADPHVQKLGRVLRERQAHVESALHDFDKDRSRPFEERAQALEAARAGVKEVQDALSHESRRSFTLGFGVPGADAARFTGTYARSTTPQARGWEAAREHLELVSRKDAVGDQHVLVASARSRAEYQYSTIRTAKTDGPEISAHEFGHHLEETPHVLGRVKEFRAARFDSTKDVPMRQVAPQAGYGKDEVGNEDDMLKVFGNANDAAYAGKTYPGGRTEILSMGLQKLHEDPMHLAKADPQYFGLVVGILQRGPRP